MELNIIENMSLQGYNTMAVPAKARYFLVAHDQEELTLGIKFAKKNNLRLFILGEGSNTLFVNDFDGLVILNQIMGIEVVQETDEAILLNVCAGENWHELVTHTIENNWYGLENLALIPGSVGAAPIQNIGAYGAEVRNVIQSVEFIDLDSMELMQLSHDDCQFSYRDSIFKNDLLGKVIITAVKLQLHKSGELNITYPALKEYFGDNQAKLQTVYNAVCSIRSSKLPNPKEIPNSGSFFKNPIVSSEKYEQLKAKYPNIISFRAAQGYKLAAGWLIEHLGWKDKEIESVKVHGKQALVIINPSEKTGEAVLVFAKAIQNDVLNNYGVELTIEPTICGINCE